MSSQSLVFKDILYTRDSFDLYINLHFPKAQLTVVLGPSGCGKTTMLDLASGFLRPNSGIILEGDRDVTASPPDKRKMGVVFQDYALFPHLNVMDNVAYGPLMRGFRRREARSIANHYLDIVSMRSVASKQPSSLSGGEKQRVALARALATEPDYLLMDEPFNSLDAAMREELRREFTRIQKNTGITTILVTHDQSEALALADNLALMRAGRIVQAGKSRNLWDNPVNLFAATFIGRTTRLRVKKITRKTHGTSRVETDAGVISLEDKFCDVDLPATLVVRPENLQVSEGKHVEAEIEGLVEETEYAGGYWKIRLAVGDKTNLIDCNMSRTTPPVIGEKLRLSIKPGSARLLSGLMEDWLRSNGCSQDACLSCTSLGR